MENNPKPTTIVRIKGDYSGTYRLKNTVCRSHEITPEGDHLLVLEATAAHGAASRPPRRRSKTPASPRR